MHEFNYSTCRIERLAEFGLDDTCCSVCGNLHARLEQAATQLPLTEIETVTWFRFVCTACGHTWLCYRRTVYLNADNPHRPPACNTGVNPSFGKKWTNNED